MYLITSLNVWDQYVSLYVRAQEFYVGEANCTFKVKTNINNGIPKVYIIFVATTRQSIQNNETLLRLYNNSTCEC